MSTKTFASILAILLFQCATAPAQNTSGTITGRVLDPAGAVVPNAGVHATNTATGTLVSARTNAAGIYEISFLTPGVYDLSLEVPGFKKVERTGIELRVNDILNIELQLQVGNAAETVQVTASAPLIESETASQGQVVEQLRIQNLPLQAGNAAELTLFAPGVVNTTNLRARKTSFNSASSQFITDGNQLYSNEYAIDGVPDTFASGNTPLVAFQPPQFAVSEFRVQTSAYDAALGHTTGAVINLVSISGTNQVHGELHEWFSNSFLDAPTFFQNRAGIPKPEYQDNRYGASIGAPVLIPKLYNGHNKTFFFYAWESNQWGKPVTTVGTVPTDAERNGDFSALLKLGPAYKIYDPATTVALPNGRFQRQEFPGNMIPSTRIDPLARKILSYYAEPNTPGTNAGQNNYTQSIKDTFDYYVHFVRLDHYFSEKNRMFVRLDYDHYLETDPGFYNNVSGGINLTRINRGAAVDDVLVLSANTILGLRYGLTQEEAPEQRISAGINLGALGFSSALTSLLNPRTETFPQIYLNTKATTKSCPGACTGTFSGFGNFNNGDGTTTGMVHQLAGTLNTLKGSHDLHYGAEFRLYRSFGFNGGFDVSPQYQFLPTYTNGPLDNSPAAPLGQELAALELGIPSTGQITRSASFAIQSVYEGWFLQDNWKVKPRLTLNLGLRMEHESPVTERYDRAVRGFDATSANPIAAQAVASYAKYPISLLPVSQFQVRGGLQFAGSGNHTLWSQPAVTLLPRIGLAWQVDQNTVIRGGFGIYYDTIGVNRSPAIQSGFTSSTPIVPSYDNGQTFAASLSNPFPNGLLPGIGAAGKLTTFLGQALNFYPTDRLQPYAQRWSMGVQRMIAHSFLIEATYVGNKSIHLPVSHNINATPLQYLSTSPLRDQATITRLSTQVPNPFYGLNPVYPSQIAVADLLRPYPEFGDITYTDSNGYSWYHALQVRAEKRFSHGYTVNLAYTWSKFMDATSYLNDGDARLNRSISQYDRPQRIVISGIWELPVGRGRTYFSGMNRGVDAFLGGWQLNGSFAQQSGAPLGFGVIYYGTIGQIALPSDQRTVDQWFNTSLFERSSSRQRQYDIRTFPKYFAGIRGPNQSQVNVSLFKTFKFRDRWNLQFRAECYDLFNHPNFNDPNTTVTSSSFGTITAQGSPSRQFQGALRLSF
jgi:hypothetical protein